MRDPGWGLVISGPARRAIDRLPEKVALAVLDFLLGPLVENPLQLGKPLRGDLEDLHSARVGAYRVVYEVDESAHNVRVIDIDHLADVYRRR